MEKMRVILITLFMFVGAIVAKEVDISRAINPAREADISKAINPAKDADMGKVVNSVEDADIGKAINPAEYVDIGKVINFAEDANIDKAIHRVDDVDFGGRTINASEGANMGKANYPMFIQSQPQTYESPTFKGSVIHCGSHVAETCSRSKSIPQTDGAVNHSYGLALCLFDSMEKCLVDHGASLYETTPSNHQVQAKNTPRPKPTPTPLPDHPSLPLQSREKPPADPSPPLQPKDVSSNHNYHQLLIETIKFQTVLRTCTHVSAQTCYTGPNVATSVLVDCLVPSMIQCVYPTGA